MALELNSVLGMLECQHVQDLKDAQSPADDPCAAAARDLLSATCAIVEETNKLRAQITTLSDSLTRERSRAEALRAEADAVKKERDVALSAREAGERKYQTLKDSLARERARADALQGAADEAKATEREMQTMKKTHSQEMEMLRTSSAKDRDVYQQREEWIVARYRAFAAESNATLQGIFDTIKQLDQIPHLLPPNSVLATTQPTIPAPAADQKRPISGDVSVPPKRSRTESDPTSTNQPDTSAVKRPRTESSPTVTIASATSPTAPGQVGLAQAQRPGTSVQPQPPPARRTPVTRFNTGRSISHLITRPTIGFRLQTTTLEFLWKPDIPVFIYVWAAGGIMIVTPFLSEETHSL
ncbi:hypothetical protein MVEN_01686800 [Mycena venus]|uniref:Uncharacterized protein n=1 Tax=Mycena venus TaxID=2733690 RepID=A0A8H7CPY7_9AGAR|nr:hypothetical protein MVEN_01686800 [Mycena venus]